MSTVTQPLPAPRLNSRRRIAERGEPWAWLSAGGLALAVVMIAGLLLIVTLRGTATFWPQPIVQVTLSDGRVLLGEFTRVEQYEPTPDERARWSSRAAPAGAVTRRLLRIGNYDFYGRDFEWIAVPDINDISYPASACIIERLDDGPFFGELRAVNVDGRALAAATDPAEWLRHETDAIVQRRRAIARIEDVELGRINARMERARLDLRAATAQDGGDRTTVVADIEGRQAELAEAYTAASARLSTLRDEDHRYTLTIAEITGRSKTILASDVVRTYAANRTTWTDRAGIYLDRWREFLVTEPRQANSAGGVFPAIFGTVIMTMLMSLFVGPLGIVAALYLREYAHQGTIVSAIRIAVGNLAGVPSIVYGIFGLGFFCYGVGGMIDGALFSEHLPAPTFGTTGILWSSLTLALLTLPVVIVSTEEALAAVPGSMREGSYACGASRWQTIRRIVLPKAMPGILTGLILAMARGAGEVAPLMITGAVKLAPDLPVDGEFPYVHLQRSFMHLGFHIYDVGFQSRNSEAAKPMVFTTTLLLIAIVVLLNFAAMFIRGRLRRRLHEAKF